MICVWFIDYPICIISNNLFNYSIKYYSDVPLTNKTRIIFISKQFFFANRHTPSGRIGKVVAVHAEGCKVARSNPCVAELHRFILCTRRSGGTTDEGGGWDQSIGSTIFDAIVLSWLWSTATRRSQLSYFRRLLQVVDNWPHILW